MVDVGKTRVDLLPPMSLCSMVPVLPVDSRTGGAFVFVPARIAGPADRRRSGGGKPLRPDRLSVPDSPPVACCWRLPRRDAPLCGLAGRARPARGRPCGGTDSCETPLAHLPRSRCGLLPRARALDDCVLCRLLECTEEASPRRSGLLDRLVSLGLLLRLGGVGHGSDGSSRVCRMAVRESSGLRD